MKEPGRPGGGASETPVRRGANEARPLETPLAALVRISRAVGSDPDLIQGTAGNTSIKTGGGRTLLVKVSGGVLADMDAAGGWAELDLDAVQRLLDRDNLLSFPEEGRDAEVQRLLVGAVREPKGAVPSVETGLHALLDTVVIHSHPAGLNCLLASRDSREKHAEVLAPLGEPVLYLPYTDPGFVCAFRAKGAIEEHAKRHGRPPRVVLLENHGVFVAAADPDECLELHGRVTALGTRWAGGARVNPARFAAAPGPGGPAEDDGSGGACAVRGALLAGGAEPCLVRADSEPIAAEFLASPDAVRAAVGGPFTPDQIVYCRTEPLVLEGADPAPWKGLVAAYRARHGLDPRVVLRPPAGGFRGEVLYAARDMELLRSVGDVFRTAMAIAARSGGAGGPRRLDGDQIGYIERIYARKTRLHSERPRRLEGRVAAVTGAGSGLGKAIARGIAGAGATVFALDLDAAALDSASEDFPAGKFIPVSCDVTVEESVASAFRTIEAAAGGLDHLVNAAGIAPSFALVDFPLAAWKRTLDINLTGYFLCAREAARLLVRQGAGGGIVNLASKSGLDASKDNSAYNATKAAEIHLMRGWALELGKSGIRVNCIAPGNVFKGSKIWNDEYIRACARKKGIRPEEVIPYYTSLTALGREIQPEDVANAVIFLLAEESRCVTGQTLVVDGGQVMVR